MDLQPPQWPHDAVLDALLTANDTAVVGVSTTGVIGLWSDAAVRLFGQERGAMLGQNLSQIVPAERRAEARRMTDSLLRGQTVEPIETVRLGKKARRLHVSWWATPIRDAEGIIAGILFLARDISERHKAQGVLAELQASAQHRAIVLETANRVALDILSSRSGVEALRHIADAARVLAGARYAALGVATRDGQNLSEFITVGLTPDEEAAIGPRPRGAGVLGLLLHRTEPLRVDVLAHHPASVGFPSNHPPMDSFLGVPIRRGDLILGSLYLTNKQGGGAFTLSDEVAVEALGAHAAIAIYNWHMVSRQRGLVSGLITAQEEERRAVAYDLHDGLTQFVMASHAHLEAFKRAREKDDTSRANREFEIGTRYLKEAVVESRRLVNGLRSLALDDLGLSGALEQLVGEEKARAGWESTEWVCNLGELRFDKTLETTAYRIAQEALTNARKHAATNRVEVTLRFEEPETGPQLHLLVRDWGQGFAPDEKIGEVGGVGLQGMAERVGLLNGKFRLAAAPGEGTCIEATLPAQPVTDDEIADEESKP